MTRLVLASASPARLSVLRNAGVDSHVIVSAVDEDAIIAAHPDESPGRVVTLLAIAKADDVVSRLSSEVAADCVVVGCDSMLEMDGQICGKPGSVDAARARWQAMAGREGVLHTGHAVVRVRDGRPRQHTAQAAATTVRFGAPSRAEIETYLASGEPLAVAGAFTLDGLGGWFVDGIDGDPSNVIGISLPLLRQMLGTVGVSVAELWQQR
jgi:septum formation protein